jgi:hypothetical protein
LPALIVSITSIGCLLGSHSVLAKRNGALMAAYSVIATSYSQYRNRVINKLGGEADRDFRFGENLPDEVNETNITADDGTDVKVVEKKHVKTPTSDYARDFNPVNKMFKRTDDQNMFFLKCAQTWANEHLDKYGHIFLNEVYDLLCIDHSPEGQLVGWLKRDKNDPRGDSRVDFGLNGPQLYKDDRDRQPYPADRRLSDPKVLTLDFNVDGVIWDLI